jgi:hypothetical protein
MSFGGDQMHVGFHAVTATTMIADPDKRLGIMSASQADLHALRAAVMKITSDACRRDPCSLICGVIICYVVICMCM